MFNYSESSTGPLDYENFKITTFYKGAKDRLLYRLLKFHRIDEKGEIYEKETIPHD